MPDIIVSPSLQKRPPRPGSPKNGHQVLPRSQSGPWKRQNRLHTSLLFWRSLLANVLQTERTEFLFSFPLNGGQLPANYREAKPKILYAGPTRRLPGMEGPGEEITAVMSAEGVGTLLDMLER